VPGTVRSNGGYDPTIAYPGQANNIVFNGVDYGAGAAAHFSDVTDAVQAAIPGLHISFVQVGASNYDMILENTTGSAITLGGDMATFLGTTTLAAAAPGGAGPATIGALNIAVGAGTSVNLAGTYANSQALVDAVNSKVSGAYASVDANHHLVITSSDKLTISGAGATTLGITSADATSGSLNTQTVKTVAGANAAMQSVDSALNAVSTLRSSLGAIQNRFQSVINSLQAVSENLSASRSRILDTDFASETASLTRAQILQQAGTAMVAQANQVPQNVLSLLR
jgi:flagellin